MLSILLASSAALLLSVPCRATVGDVTAEDMFHALKNKAAASLEPLSACRGGICPGLGNLFYLPEQDIFEPLGSGQRILKKVPELGNGDCVRYRTTAESSIALQTYQSMEELVRSESLDVGIGFSIPAAAGFALGLSVESNTGTSTSYSRGFESAKLRIQATQGIIDFDASFCIRGLQAFTENFLLDFAALPMISAEQVASASAWAPYVTFLKFRGSHMMVQQTLGSAFTVWESSENVEEATANSLGIKACMTADFQGVSLSPCVGYTEEEKERASRVQSYRQLLVQGGTPVTRNNILRNMDKSSLNAFINASQEGDLPISYGFVPIWDILLNLFRTDCGQNSQSCEHLQRALNLQAAFEGWLALDCQEHETAEGYFVQQMQVQSGSGPGHLLYQCWNAKTGCRKDSDCHYGVSSWFGCYCYGSNCFDQGDQIPGGGFYTTLRKTRLFSKRADPNPSCYYKGAGCKCNAGWGGGLPDRAIYLQGQR